MKGRQNARTLKYWSFTLKKPRRMVSGPGLGQNASHHAPTLDHLASVHQDRLGCSRTGQSLGSKAVLFAQARYEIDSDGCTDLTPSIQL